MLKEKDFVELEYTGKIKESGNVFDTTSKQLAEAEGIFDENSQYGPTLISLGAHQLLEGLEQQLVGKEPGKSYTIELSPEQAFGKKDAKLLKLIATRKFVKQGVQPMPGLRVNIDGSIGTIKTVTGGRTIVDFNHPLAGQNLLYDVKVNKVVKNTEDQLKGLLKLELMQADAKVSIKEGTATVELKMEVPAEYLKKFKARAMELIPKIKSLRFKLPTNLNTSSK